MPRGCSRWSTWPRPTQSSRAWDSKKFYNFWRPLTAIREGNNDTNPGTIGDPDWKPLINTPNYPDYTSGANNVTGSATKMLSLFFKRDKMTFTVTSTIRSPCRRPVRTDAFPMPRRMSSTFVSTRASISASPTRRRVARAAMSRNGHTSTSSDRCTANTTKTTIRERIGIADEPVQEAPAAFFFFFFFFFFF